MPPKVGRGREGRREEEEEEEKKETKEIRFHVHKVGGGMNRG
jgi:hypothetical protein